MLVFFQAKREDGSQSQMRGPGDGVANMDAALIGLDWGTSSFRAWKMARDGTVIDRVSLPMGILAVPDGDFDAAFESAVGAWLAERPEMPIVASGMISSANGWCETPYLPLPLDAGDLARALTNFETSKGRKLSFVSGAACNPADGLPDVMRGEETELVGNLVAGGRGEGLFVLPGTHSKWALVENGRLTRFETYMTGELYAVLGRHSILGRLVPDEPVPSQQAFRRGVETARQALLSITATMFSTRTLALFDRLDRAEIPDYLSGLLVGEEIRSGVAAHSDIVEVTLIGQGDLADRYAEAFDVFGIATTRAPVDMARLGLLEIARRAGLVAAG